MEPGVTGQPVKWARSRVVSVCPYPSPSASPVAWVNCREISGWSFSPAVTAWRRVGIGGMSFRTR